MKTRQKKLFSPFLLSALPVMGLTAGSFATVMADPIVIEPMAPSVSEPIRAAIDEKESEAPIDPKDYPQGLLFPYSLLDAAYKNNIDFNGHVAYANLKDNKKLSQYVQAAAFADLSEFPVFDIYKEDEETGRKTKVGKDHRAELVFWINTYNALMLYNVAQAYPIKSIDLIKNFDTEKKHRVAGKDYSFKELREKVASFGDPRALFALTSGTAGGFLPSPTAIRYVELSPRLDAAVSVSSTTSATSLRAFKTWSSSIRYSRKLTRLLPKAAATSGTESARCWRFTRNKGATAHTSRPTITALISVR